MLSVFIGLITTGLSLWGMFLWRQDLVVVLKGFLPLCFLMGGIVAVIAGASSMGAKPPAEGDRAPSDKKK